MIIIVIGMHRSGTSALAGLLHNNNIVFGEEISFIPKPSQENVKGFYENYIFRKINDDIVAKCGYRIKSWEIKIPQMQASTITKYRMRRLLLKYNNNYDKWGWKDPRTCLTLKLWLKELSNMTILDSCKIIYITRDPRSVAKSMVQRNNISFEHALELWRIYNERALEAIDAYKIDSFYLSYEQLCNNSIKMAKYIFDFVEQSFDEKIVELFIDSKLNRSMIIMDEYRANDETIKEVNKIEEKISKRIVRLS